MRHTPTLSVTLILFGLGLLAGGCSQQTIDSAKNDAQRNITAAKPQIAKLSLGGRVTTALAAAAIHGVRVDADTNGVSLHGTVATRDEKARAGRIARETLGKDKAVANDILVRNQ